MSKQPFELFIIALADLYESKSKEWVMRCQQRSRCLLINCFEELLDKALSPTIVVGLWNGCKFLILLDDLEEDVHELRQGKPVQEVDRWKALEGKVHSRRHVCDWYVVFCCLIDFLHGIIGRCHFFCHVLCFLLQRLQSVNQFVILEQVAFRLIQFVQQLVFKVSELDAELAL